MQFFEIVSNLSVRATTKVQEKLTVRPALFGRRCNLIRLRVPFESYPRTLREATPGHAAEEPCARLHL